MIAWLCRVPVDVVALDLEVDGGEGFGKTNLENMV